MSFVLMDRQHHDAGMSPMAPSPGAPTPLTEAVVIRPAHPDDAATLARLAQLDSSRPLTGRIVLAERSGRVLAALATSDGRMIADPFAPTADLVALLRMHAADTATHGAGRRELLRRRGANLRRPPALARG
jgi:hypothetical protein